MKIHHPLILLSALWLLAPLSFSDWRSDYAQLTDQVPALTLNGTAGSIAIVENLAFPIAQSPKRETIAACGYFNDKAPSGRVVALAHTSLGSNTTPEMQGWFANLSRWASRRTHPSVLVLAQTNPEWPDANLLASPKTWNSNALQNVHCVFINLHNITPEFATAAIPDLVRFANSGGGIVISATPWAAKPALLEFAGKLLGPAGLAFLPNGPSDLRLPLGVEPSPLASGQRAADALEAELTGSKALSLAERQDSAISVESCLAANLISEPLRQTLQRLHQRAGWSKCTAENPLRRNLQPLNALMARYESWWLKQQPASQTPAHPLASDFPGMPSAGPTLKKTINFSAKTGPDRLINHGEHTRLSTGLYARPGQPVRIALPPEAVDASLQLEIGIHTDKNWNLTQWRRFPEISTTTTLKATETYAANAFGGLISILIPANCAVGAVEVTIDGAVAAPRYELGKTTDSQWRELRNAPGAWGSLETPLWTGYFPKAQLQSMDDPGRIASYWHRAVETADQFLGYGKWRKRGESMLVDRDISNGYGHAGYPVMMAYGAEAGEAPSALMERGPTRGDWGFLHELGHTFQDSFDGNYTIATHAEVDVNLVPALVLQKLHNRTSWDNNSHGTFDAKTRIADLETWARLPAADRTWEKACKMNVAYDFYFTLAECFGWELYQRAFGRWMNWLQQPGSDPALDYLPSKEASAKRDRFLVLFSEESGFNLTEYFEKYGLGFDKFPLSAAALTRVARLPIWTGNRAIERLEGPDSLKIAANQVPMTSLATFSAKDPDPGTIFSYKIAAGNEDEAFHIELRTGVLTLNKPSKTSRKLLVEVQDNCIPLSKATKSLAVTFEP